MRTNGRDGRRNIASGVARAMALMMLCLPLGLGAEAAAQIPRVGTLFLPASAAPASRSIGAPTASAVALAESSPAAWTDVAVYSARSAALAMPQSIASVAAIQSVPILSPIARGDVRRTQAAEKGGEESLHAEAAGLFDAEVSREELERHLEAHGLRGQAPADAEAPALFAFMRDQRLPYGVSSLPPEDPHSGDHDLLRVEDNYARSGGEFIVVKDRDGRIAGTAAVFPLAERTMEIRKMYVDESLRGKKIGKALLVHLIKAAMSRGFSRFVLETTPMMEDAIGLYTSVGFRRFENSDRHFPDARVIFYRLDADEFRRKIRSEQKK